MRNGLALLVSARPPIDLKRMVVDQDYEPQGHFHVSDWPERLASPPPLRFCSEVTGKPSFIFCLCEISRETSEVLHAPCA